MFENPNDIQIPLKSMLIEDKETKEDCQMQPEAITEEAKQDKRSKSRSRQIS